VAGPARGPGPLRRLAAGRDEMWVPDWARVRFDVTTHASAGSTGLDRLHGSSSPDLEPNPRPKDVRSARTRRLVGSGLRMHPRFSVLGGRPLRLVRPHGGPVDSGGELSRRSRHWLGPDRMGRSRGCGRVLGRCRRIGARSGRARCDGRGIGGNAALGAAVGVGHAGPHVVGIVALCPREPGEAGSASLTSSAP